jgi:gamma-glutamylcysteine synthetase
MTLRALRELVWKKFGPEAGVVGEREPHGLGSLIVQVGELTLEFGFPSDRFDEVCDRAAQHLVALR